MNHSKNEQLMARKAAATPRGVGVMGTFFAERAQGAELWDAEGRRFIDFAGGIAVMNVGHGHPKVVAAIEAQLKRFTHTCYQVVPYEGYIALAERKPADAVPLLVEATAIEDSLTYDEPHLWLAPTRHALGAALVAEGRGRDAERVFREDLAHYPENGWSLVGLARALRLQGRNEAAKEVDARFREAWREADVQIAASRF